MTASNNNANAYLRTKVLTASPEELRLMLLDGAIRFCRQGRDGIANRDWEASFNGFSKCRKILTELMTSMRPEIDPDLCARLTGLYTFFYTHLIEAAHEKSVAKADRVIELLEYERETWVMLMGKVREERGGAGGPAPIPTPGVSQGVAPAAYRPVSIQG
jgi:flagellar secretion chaperone FliS